MDSCLRWEAFSWLALIFKYFDKNKKLIEDMVTSSSEDFDELLISCLKNTVDLNHESFFSAYFEVCNKLKYCFKESGFNESINFCKKYENLIKYVPIIRENYEKLKQYLK